MPDPVCGMDLEPKTITAEETENPELKAMNGRFWVRLVLTVPVFALAMVDVLPGHPVQSILSTVAVTWIELLLATPVVLCGGDLLPAGLRLPGQPESEHVHPDRPRHRSCLPLQPG